MVCASKVYSGLGADIVMESLHSEPLPRADGMPMSVIVLISIVTLKVTVIVGIFVPETRLIVEILVDDLNETY